MIYLQLIGAPTPTRQQLVCPAAIELEFLSKPAQIVIAQLLREVPGAAPIYSLLPKIGRL
jgi:hypothetical protein